MMKEGFYCLRAHHVCFADDDLTMQIMACPQKRRKFSVIYYTGSRDDAHPHPTLDKQDV